MCTQMPSPAASSCVEDTWCSRRLWPRPCMYLVCKLQWRGKKQNNSPKVSDEFRLDSVQLMDQDIPEYLACFPSFIYLFIFFILATRIIHSFISGLQVQKTNRTRKQQNLHFSFCSLTALPLSLLGWPSFSNPLRSLVQLHSSFPHTTHKWELVGSRMKRGVSQKMVLAWH